MNVIPHMNYPALEDVLPYVDGEKFPCAEEARRILLEETSLGNVIQAVGDAGCMPDETVVVIDFDQDAKRDYSGSVHKPWGNDRGYRFVSIMDKYHGVLYFRFFYKVDENKESKQEN